MSIESFWRKCSSCKKPIPFGGRFFRCSVSTCNAKRTSYVFCSMPCWSAHVPTLNHRNPWAEDDHAPSREQALSQQQLAAARPERDARRRVVAEHSSAAPGTHPNLNSGQQIPHDVLVVVSKAKAYILARSGCKTSGSVNDALSDIIRSHCDRAISRAMAEGRGTIMGRDFEE